MTSNSQRRGARHPLLVPQDVRLALEAGRESVNHMEQIAMDMGSLLASQFPALKHRASELRGAGLVARMRIGGQILLEELGLDAVCAGTTWGSDTARGWAAMALGQAPNVSLPERLALLRPFVDDPHFAVREWAWLSVRPHIAADVPRAVKLVAPWTGEDSERLRRFASESTRPRGVWSPHITRLKSHPELGLPVLEPLRSDPSRYVQDSVANWLNDAAKTRPDWVTAICQRWTAESTAEATHRICRRAQRSIQPPRC